MWYATVALEGQAACIFKNYDWGLSISKLAYKYYGCSIILDESNPNAIISHNFIQPANSLPA